jgi:hypothetical protein
MQHNQALPPKVGALGAWETLEGAFEMTTQYPDTLKIWAWFQQGNVGPDEGSNFIIGDGCIHFSVGCNVYIKSVSIWIW